MASAPQSSSALPPSTTDQTVSSAILQKLHALASWLRPASTDGAGELTGRRDLLDTLVVLCAVVAGLAMSSGFASLRSSTSVDFPTIVFSVVGGGLWAAITYTVLQLASTIRLQSSVGHVGVILLVSIMAAATAQMFTLAVISPAFFSNGGANLLLEFIVNILPAQQGELATLSDFSARNAVRAFDVHSSILFVLLFLTPVLFSRAHRRTDALPHPQPNPPTK